MHKKSNKKEKEEISRSESRSDQLSRKKTQEDLKSLREQTKKPLSTHEQPNYSVDNYDIKQVLHELSVYQNELENQNEELRHMQELLEESRDRYYKLFEFAPVGYLNMDENGLISDINQVGVKLLGGAREKVLGKGLAGFIEEEYRHVFYKHLKKIIQSGQQSSCELRLTVSNRPPFYARLVSVSIDKSSAGKKYIQAALIDINDTKIIEEKNNFIAIMSHELRNPLTPILSGIQLVRKQVKKNLAVEKNRDYNLNEYTKMIEQHAKYMSHLLDDLLDISRISTGRIKLKKRSIDLISSAKNAVKAVRPLINKQRQKFVVYLPTEPFYVEADPVRIEQILINLLNNAIKYTPPKGSICLEVKRSGKSAEIIVRDNGIGIEQITLRSIFDLFAHSTKPFISTAGDLGVGLKLSKDLVTLHGGTIDAVSEGRNKGSKFTVLLPALPQNLQLKIESQAEVPADNKKLRVLIVDDNNSIVKIFDKIIKYMGHDTCTANDGVSALRVAEECRPQVALVDIGMPGMSGYDVARKLRQLEKKLGLHMKLIAITGYGQEEDKHRAQAAGFNEHLTKPIDIDTLEKAIIPLGG